MQARRWSGYRAVCSGEDGLIAFLVLRMLDVAFNVRRQRNLAKSVKFAADVRCAEELQPPPAFVVGFNDGGMNFIRFAIGAGKNDLCANTSRFAGAHHGPPVILLILFEQQDLEFAAGFGVDAAQSGRNHA